MVVAVVGALLGAPGGDDDAASTTENMEQWHVFLLSWSGRAFM